MNRIDPRRTAGYDEDFALWSAEQAALLREGRLDRVDLENVAEEIASLGRSDKYEIDSRLEVLLQHLAKWAYQPDKRSRSWSASIFEQRMRIARVLARSPSLKSYPAQSLAGGYTIARHEALKETGLPEAAIPETCPWSIAQILDPDFLPE